MISLLLVLMAEESRGLRSSLRRMWSEVTRKDSSEGRCCLTLLAAHSAYSLLILGLVRTLKDTKTPKCILSFRQQQSNKLVQQYIIL